MTEFKQRAEPTPYEPLINHRKAVVIVAMGTSRNDFTTMQMTERRPSLMKDAEIWGINYLGAAWHLDRLVHVDPIWPYLGNDVVREMCEKTLKSNTPVYTSWPYCPSTGQSYSNFQLYPFDKIVETLGVHYINGSVSAAIALAMYEGFNEISLFGCDFSYPDAHVAESGRACCEFWLGVASQRGIKVAIAQSSTLLDINVNQQPYGWFADPLKPPVAGGRLMNVQEIIQHCKNMREPRLKRPDFYTFEPATPGVIQPIAPGGVPHPAFMGPGSYRVEEAAQLKPEVDGKTLVNGHDVGTQNATRPNHISGHVS